MTLSEREQAQLAAVDRVLSRDPVLRALADLFVEPPKRLTVPAARTRHGRDRLLVTMVCCLAVVLLGVGATLLGVHLAMPVLVGLGLGTMIGASLVFAVVAICRGAEPGVPPTPSGGYGPVEEGGPQSFQARAEDS